MRAHPVGHELAWHDEVEGAAIRLEGAKFGRLQPTVECASTEITAKPRANGVPGSLERRRDRRPSEFNRRIQPSALHLLAPPLPDPRARQSNSVARRPSRAPKASFRSCSR